MAKVATIQTSFNTGELSPLMDGRVDFDKYKSALALCLNQIPLVQGPVTRRPGTVFVSEIKNSANPARLVRFEFSTTQAYILEFGPGYIRVYANHGQIQSGGAAVEISTPYSAADVPTLMFTQSADVLYIAHQNYAPRSLSRTSDTSWTLGTLSFTDGPYLDANTTGTTLTFSATTGAATCTASSTTGINNGAGFQATDVGRHVRAQTVAGIWGWGIITAVADTTHCTVSIQQAMGATTATTNWRLGLWSDTTGYPACVTFYQDRLGWAGAKAAPETTTFSMTGNYLNHQPTAYDTAGTVADDMGLSFTLDSNDVQAIRWMQGDANGLLIGTVAGEWAVSPSSLNEALTPTNINAKQMTSYGNAQVAPIRVGYTTLTLQRSLRKLREITFVYYENRYHAPDMTVLAQHVTLGGVKEMCWQQEPQSIVWCVRNDGTLLGFTYERDQNVTGWHRHVIGGQSDSGGTQAKVESVASIPAPDGTRDEVWMIVQRYIGGQTKRYVEYMTKIWEHGDSQTNAVYVDAAISYNGTATKTVAGATHLAGETVKVLADGSVHPDVTVAADGSVTLNRAASVITIGYGYNSDGQDLQNDAGSANGTAQGKTQRTHRVAFRLLDSLGLKTGRDFSNLSPVEEIGRRGSTPLGQSVPLFTGDASETWEGDYSFNNQICWRFDQPLPGTILAIMPQLMTMDR